MQKPGFAGSMKAYFGLLPGETMAQFAAELKALSYEEKMEFHAMLTGAGVDCEQPVAPKT